MLRKQRVVNEFLQCLLFLVKHEYYIMPSYDKDGWRVTNENSLILDITAHWKEIVVLIEDVEGSLEDHAGVTEKSWNKTVDEKTGQITGATLKP